MTAERETNQTSILVVDDEAGVCRSVEKILNRKGYQVSQALCVSSALDTLEGGRAFDLIIADLMMPQVGGLELLKIVRDRWPDTPVLIITGYASIASAVESTKNGAVGYLPKPFTPQELEQAVEQVLSSSPFEVPRADNVTSAGPIDVDMPFDRQEVALATSARYVEHLTRSDMPLIESQPAPAVDYCSKGQRSCKRMIKQGMCKQPECPLMVAERKKAAKAGIVVSLIPDPIDVDMPFSRTEVASVTGEAYVNALGRSDMPVTGFWKSAKAAAQTPKVLVVDDEPVVVNSIRKTLARKAFKVAEAFSGREALARIAAESFDLVLLDMKLPDANGLELVRDIKKRKPNLRIVIVTGYASIDTAVEAIRRGANDYMPKPFTPDELYATTDRVLNRGVA
ncbi:MAG TPA: response regulator [Acidobacteriota bacterium]|nr:response regulator [Acidobacteriota bacterium]